jgi:DsbC/DsbD-like thiol-disulfide interchange protein
MGLAEGFLMMLLAIPGASSYPQDEDPVKWSVKAESPSRSYPAGGKFKVVLEATIAEGWHLYAPTQSPGSPVIATRVFIPEGPAFMPGGEIEAPLPQVAQDPNFGVETEFYEGSAAFIVPVAISAGAVPGKQTLTINSFYQTCNDQMCLPPKSVASRMTVEIVPSK